MPKLQWDLDGQKIYETGAKNGALYVNDKGTYQPGVAWNGLISVTESPTGAEPTALYADDIKYLSLMSAEEFEASIEAYTYPDEFMACDGSAELSSGITIGQQNRSKFALAYVTTVGNDTEGTAFGRKIHVIYGAQASPSEKAYSTINDSPEAITFSWDVTTTPVAVEGYKPTSIVTIDSTKVSAESMKAIEDALFGTDDEDAKLLMPDEILALVKTP